MRNTQQQTVLNIMIVLIMFVLPLVLVITGFAFVPGVPMGFVCVFGLMLVGIPFGVLTSMVVELNERRS